MNSKNTFILAGVLALVLIVFSLIWYWAGVGSGKPNPARDNFAMCLRDKQITMYGAYWCSHCQNEKRAFGDSFKFVSYVECTKETAKCAAAGIQGFPTWIFPDGRRFEGEQGSQKLSEESGCPLSG